MYLFRELEDKVLNVFGKKIIIIRGPRRSGKTTLLKRIKELKGGEYITFEDPITIEAFLRDPIEFIRERGTPLYLDEIQYLGEDGARALKLIYDKLGQEPIIVSGSGAFDIKMNLLKYLVGRVYIFDMLPLNFGEVVEWKSKEASFLYSQGHKKIYGIFKGKDKLPEKSESLEKLYEEYCVWGGYPEIVITKDRELLSSLVTTTIEEDIIKYFSLRESKKLWNVVKRLAVITGNLLDYSSMGVSYATAQEYISILERSFVVKTLPTFSTNKLIELTKREKVYFYDSGFRNQLIGIFSGIRERPDGGATLENSIWVQLQEYGNVSYWRTKSKAEVDFIIGMEDGSVIPIEVKLTGKITPSLLSFIKKYQPDIALVLSKDTFEKKVDDTMVYGVPYYYI
ncbi:ATP-binding protein [Candidatus Micrarchaeota archaeon]|nr:ATP-binding protein [Candidatus Micrarchaeota archaeon]